MPKITKQFYLEVTVEQFLCACSHTELQEINMRLDAHLRRTEKAEPEGIWEQHVVRMIYNPSKSDENT